MPGHQRKINDQTTTATVRLIGPDGRPEGLVGLPAARDRAESAGLDLVEVAGDANPPVVRLADWATSVGDDSARTRRRRRDVKEVRLHPTIADHDRATKVAQIRRFLAHGLSVRVVMVLRGREVTHPGLAVAALDAVLEQVSGLYRLPADVRRNERRWAVMLRPSAAHSAA